MSHRNVKPHVSRVRNVDRAILLFRVNAVHTHTREEAKRRQRKKILK